MNVGQHMDALADLLNSGKITKETELLGSFDGNLVSAKVIDQWVGTSWDGVKETKVLALELENQYTECEKDENVKNSI